MRTHSFSTHNDYVSLAGPGAGASGCELGVFSILPSAGTTEWDDPLSCSRLFSQGRVRFAYGEGTSFAAPFASAMASLAWQVQPRLASEQVADVLIRSARQTLRPRLERAHRLGRGGRRRGHGAGPDIRRDRAAEARQARRRDGSSVAVHVGRTHDRTLSGHELAGHVRYGILVSRDGGQSYNGR